VNLQADTLHKRVAEALRDHAMLAATRDTAVRKQSARLEAWAELGDIEALRTLAADIKRHTLDNLDAYLHRFTERVKAAGGRVHFAATRGDAVRIVADIARDSRARTCVQAKSMAAEEIGLRHALEELGLAVYETDLGEYVAQLAGDKPSHIVAPIIHKSRREIARVLARELGFGYTEDPAELVALVRGHFRGVFRRCDMGVSGVNFGVAETGTICLCTNEGNGRYVAGRPRVHVALMGIEKLVPRLADLSVFLKLLARSSTGQRLTVYTTLLTGPRRAGEPDGPRELHVVVLDAGRSKLLAGPFRESLACLRCGACLNVCPIYRNVGGHAYAGPCPGPIGQVISPVLGVGQRCLELPHASSLCGACLEACPVRIDIPRLLLEHRSEQVERGELDRIKRFTYRVVFLAMRHRWSYRLGQRLMRAYLRRRATGGWVGSLPGLAAAWTGCRDVPVPPAETFREFWAREHPYD
jgi:L-lactate dehydrogenase complex protein LldF